MSREFVYFNGRIVGADEARVSAFDVGLTHGAGLFETFRAYDGVPYRLDGHLARLAASAKALSLAIPSDLGPWGDGVMQVLRANGLRDARIRLTMTAGDPRDIGTSAADGEDWASGKRSEVDTRAFTGTILITATAMQPPPPRAYASGMTVLVSAYKQTRFNPLAGHKTLNYFSRLIALREAQFKECGEALWFTTENLLAEGCISNVFLVKDGVLRTPPIDTPVLPGVTRAVVLAVAAAASVPAREEPLTINDLLDADEVMLTNTSMEVMPVARIERHAVRDEKPGPITRRLMDLVRARITEETGRA